MDVYKKCPVFKKELITLRQTIMDDAEELLWCYSDEQAVPLFNSDNCDGDDFHYTKIDSMREAIDFWDFSYENGYFVRWSVILNINSQAVGTIEMFHRAIDDEFDGTGVLRIDLRSDQEVEGIISEIVEIADEHFYELFDVSHILTKAIPEASTRISVLKENGYRPLGKKLGQFDHYYIK
ncbi:MAG TPA: GNAT family protein [Thermotogota bacterium]|nr:GNAT family protein [Thermotogota bacterium]HPR96891.1 GNAT family protein [Thermotogota bacterium]